MQPNRQNPQSGNWTADDDFVDTVIIEGYGDELGLDDDFMSDQLGALDGTFSGSRYEIFDKETAIANMNKVLQRWKVPVRVTDAKYIHENDEGIYWKYQDARRNPKVRRASAPIANDKTVFVYSVGDYKEENHEVIFGLKNLQRWMKIQQQDDNFYLGDLIDDFEEFNDIGALSKYPDWETDTAQYFGLYDMYQHNIRGGDFDRRIQMLPITTDDVGFFINYDGGIGFLKNDDFSQQWDDEYTIPWMMEAYLGRPSTELFRNNPKVHRKPLGNNDPLLGGIDVVFENDYEDYLSDKSGHFMNFYLPEVDLYVSVTDSTADWVAPGKHIMSFRRKKKGPRRLTNAQFDWLASNFQQAMLSESGHEYIASRGNDAYDLRDLTEFSVIAEPHEYETLKALVPSEEDLYDMMFSRRRPFRNPAPAAVYKALKTGADLDLDKLVTLPEKQSIKMIEAKFGKDTRKAKAMTIALKAKIKAIEKTGNLLRKMPVSNPKVRKKALSMPTLPTIGGSKLIPFDDIKRHHIYASSGGRERSDTRSFIVEEPNLLMTVFHGPQHDDKPIQHAVFQRPETKKAGTSQTYKITKKQLKWLAENFSKYYKPRYETDSKTLQEYFDNEGRGKDWWMTQIDEETANEITKWIRVYPKNTRNPVEMVDDKPVDIMENYYSVIYRQSRSFDKDNKGNRILRYPKNMQKAAVTITSEEGAKVRAGLLKGKWAIQAVLIPRRKGMTKRKAVKLGDEVVSRLTRSNAPRLRMNPAFGKPDDWQDDVDWDSEPSAPSDWGQEVEWDDVESNPKVRRMDGRGNEYNWWEDGWKYIGGNGSYDIASEKLGLQAEFSIHYGDGDMQLVFRRYPKPGRFTNSQLEWIREETIQGPRGGFMPGPRTSTLFVVPDSGLSAAERRFIEKNLSRRNPKVRRTSAPTDEVVKWPFPGGEPKWKSSTAQAGKVFALFNYKKEEIRIDITQRLWSIYGLKNWSLKKTNDFMKTLATILPEDIEVEYIVDERTTPYKAYCKTGWNSSHAWLDEMIYKPEMKNNPKVTGIRITQGQFGGASQMSNAWLARWVKSGPQSVSRLYDMWKMKELEL